MPNGNWIQDELWTLEIIRSIESKTFDSCGGDRYLVYEVINQTSETERKRLN